MGISIDYQQDLLYVERGVTTDLPGLHQGA